MSKTFQPYRSKSFDLYGCKSKISYKQYALKGQKLLAQGVLLVSICPGLGVFALHGVPTEQVEVFSDEAKKAFKFLNIEI